MVRPGLEIDCDRTLDLEGPSWLRGAAFFAIAVLVALALVALVTFKPHQTDESARAGAPSVSSLSAQPGVALFVPARSLHRGGRIVRNGEPLAPRTDLAEGDLASAADTAACFVVGVEIDVCLAPAARVRISSLAVSAPALQLEIGRVVTKHRARAGAPPLQLSAGVLHVETVDATFGIEHDVAGRTRVIVLEGQLELTAFGRTSQLHAGKRATLDEATASLEFDDAPPGQLARERELFASARRNVAPAPQRAAAAVVRADGGLLQPSQGPDTAQVPPSAQESRSPLNRDDGGNAEAETNVPPPVTEAVPSSAATDGPAIPAPTGQQAATPFPVESGSSEGRSVAGDPGAPAPEPAP